MLKGSLYKIVSLEQKDNAIKAVIEINKDSDIFSGHFPGQPVLPGACMLQMVKEILESTFDKTLRLKKADQIKFLRVVDPVADGTLKLELNYAVEGAEIKVTANMVSAESVCFKFKGTFVAR